MVDHEDEKAKDVVEPIPRPHLTRVRLTLQAWMVQFNSPGYVKEETMALLENSSLKKTLEETRKDEEVRKQMGRCYEFWDDCSSLLKCAIPYLERRCFAAPDPATPEYEGLSGPLIASFSPTLLKDLERLNLIMCLTRNVLTRDFVAQMVSADKLFDRNVFALINVCVRVTARGYDGEAGTQDEDRWQSVIHAYKKLLITCLQFLNNLIAQNEQRKLMLWLDLFDSHLEGDLPNFADMKYKVDMFPHFAQEAKARTEQQTTEATELDFKTPQQPLSSPFLLYIGKTGAEVKRWLTEQGLKAGATEIAAECKRRWQIMTEEQKNQWIVLYSEFIHKYREEISSSTAYKTVLDKHAKNEEMVQALAQNISQLQTEVDKIKAKSTASSEKKSTEKEQKDVPTQPRSDGTEHLPVMPEWGNPQLAKESDFRVTYLAKYGAEILQQGKDDLMKRLESYSERPSVEHASHVASPSSPAESPTSPVAPPEPQSEEEESDDDYDGIPGDDGRGLLTDVPLILGPTEIEVLPMIIQSAIVPPPRNAPGYDQSPLVMANTMNMHTVRCHLLLAQDNGRNLLRELLIFVAAWDLREEELYFQFMVKIMEAILANGLMPFSYHAFRESKDIISPAQAVIMKLLTNIFRVRQASQHPAGNPRTAPKPSTKPPMRVDAHMVNFLLTEFRRHIIPQTCALIFLQGQIRAGHAHPEDFPLNLWDMERMYEGVYQYLEFFAILTENEVWKTMLANWEITSELVTLLKELDAAIPKGQLPPAPLASTQQHNGNNDHTADANGPAPVAVERPYDVNSSAPPPPAEPYNQSPRPYIDEPADEPSDFEWRNLKKLAVLVLSSLVWKSRKVQDQIRPLDGIEAILNCCTYDEHNPYIREHAIMCLRFAMEGNEENQKVVRNLEPRGTVPNEVLDSSGYETFMDAKGKVLLRRKDGPAAKIPASRTETTNAEGSGKGKAKLETRDPKDLEQLVQQMMRELPRRVEGVRREWEGGREGEGERALKKLDKEFDGPG